MMEERATLPPGWDTWLGTSLTHLERTNRMRSLRPVLPTLSATDVRPCMRQPRFMTRACGVLIMPSSTQRSPTPCEQVLAPGEVLASWISEGGGQPGDEVAQHGGAVKLFSTNDYLGLSTHPAVRRAAADAAMLYGMGQPSDVQYYGNSAGS